MINLFSKMYQFFKIEDVFFWSAGGFLLVLLGFALYTLWNRLSRGETLQGLPRDDRL